MANSNETHKKVLKQFQSMIASSFNMRELLRNTTQLLLAGNHDDLNGQDVAQKVFQIIRLRL